MTSEQGKEWKIFHQNSALTDVATFPQTEKPQNSIVEDLVNNELVDDRMQVDEHLERDAID